MAASIGSESSLVSSIGNYSFHTLDILLLDVVAFERNRVTFLLSLTFDEGEVRGRCRQNLFLIPLIAMTQMVRLQCDIFIRLSLTIYPTTMIRTRLFHVSGRSNEVTCVDPVFRLVHIRLPVYTNQRRCLPLRLSRVGKRNGCDGRPSAVQLALLSTVDIE